MKFASVFALVGLAAARSMDQVKLTHVAERQAFVDEINAQKPTWTAAVQSRFAGMPVGHSKPLMGVNGNWSSDLQLSILKGDVEPFVPTWSATASIPDAFDSVTNWPACAKILSDIRDQSACGCCWAFGGAEAASDRMCIATKGKMQFPFSAQDVCFCANPNGCGGGQIDTPWTHIKNQGGVTGGQYQGSGPFGKGQCQDFTLPHCHHHGPVGNDPYPAENTPGCPSATSPKCSRKCDASSTEEYQKYTFKGSVQTASGETQIQQMIMEGGPVETAFTVYSDFENYAGGIYHHVSGQMMGGHAVKFVGWGVDAGTKYWKVANSWNPYWGEKGYFRIVRGNSEGGIEDGVTGSSASATWQKKGPWPEKLGGPGPPVPPPGGCQGGTPCAPVIQIAGNDCIQFGLGIGCFPYVAAGNAPDFHPGTCAENGYTVAGASNVENIKELGYVCGGNTRVTSFTKPPEKLGRPPVPPPGGCQGGTPCAPVIQIALNGCIQFGLGPNCFPYVAGGFAPDFHPGTCAQNGYTVAGASNVGDIKELGIECGENTRITSFTKPL